MPEKNIAVIGCGDWGRNLVRNFAELGALHTICDTSYEMLQFQMTQYPEACVETDYHKILANSRIKGVVVSVPASLHYMIAKESLLAGKDVFVEKPLALKVAEGRELVEIASQKGLILQVGHVLEYHPAIVKLREMVDDGEIGGIYYIYSNRLNLGKFRTEENILWSFAPHDISVILLLLNNCLPIEVSAHGKGYLNPDIADVTVTNLVFPNGVQAHIFVSWLHPFKEQRLVVIGSKAMVEFNDMNLQDKLMVSREPIEWVGQTPIPRLQNAEVVPFTIDEPLKIECQDFMQCIASRGKPRVDGRKGLQVLEVLDACQRSLESGGAIVSLSNITSDVFIHETSIIEEPSLIGRGTKVWHFCHIMPDVKVGTNCVIGQNVFIGRDVIVGNNVKLENNVSLFEGVTLEDDVFCAPSCVFTNVSNPRSHVSHKDEYQSTLVKKGATIGANATIICGHIIGRYAFIGAGSVVTYDIPDYALAYGNPARVMGWVCQCGIPLKFSGEEAHCNACGKVYIKKHDGQIGVKP